MLATFYVNPMSQRFLLTFGIRYVMDFGENSKRHSTQKTNDPQRCYYSNSALQARHRVEMKRITNRQKSLQGERYDR